MFGFNEAAGVTRGRREPKRPAVFCIVSASMRPRELPAEDVRHNAQIGMAGVRFNEAAGVTRGRQEWRIGDPMMHTKLQ